MAHLNRGLFRLYHLLLSSVAAVAQIGIGIGNYTDVLVQQSV